MSFYNYYGIFFEKRTKKVEKNLRNEEKKLIIIVRRIVLTNKKGALKMLSVIWTVMSWVLVITAILTNLTRILVGDDE